MLAKVHSKLDGWKEKLFSKGGKEVLIKAVVQTIPRYAMSIFKIPISLCKSIEHKVARFWWQSQGNKSGIHWRNWESLKGRKTRVVLVSGILSLLIKHSWLNRLGVYFNNLPLCGVGSLKGYISRSKTSGMRIEVPIPLGDGKAFC